MAEKTATDYLEAYGFKNMGNNAFVRHIGASGALDLNTERWVKVADGFECYKLDPSWGRRVEASGEVLYQVPWRLAPAYENVSGVNPGTHPEAFTWVWPEAVVAHMYRYTGEGWHKKLDKDGLMVFDADGLPKMELDEGFHLKGGRAERIE